MDIATRIKRLRKQKGLTQKSIAQILHMGRSTYTKLENGSTQMKHECLRNISKILGVPMTEITGETDVTFSEDLATMLWVMDENLSRTFYKIVPYKELTPTHIKLLKQKGLNSKAIYEDTPLGGRIYKFGPRDLFRYMVETCGMNILFKRSMINDDFWLTKWSNYLIEKEKRLSNFDKDSKTVFKDENEVEIDDYDYFISYLAMLNMAGGEERWVQFSGRDFYEYKDEFEALEYIKIKTGALDGSIMCFTTTGYDPIAEIIRPD